MVKYRRKIKLSGDLSHAHKYRREAVLKFLMCPQQLNNYLKSILTSRSIVSAYGAYH